MRFLVTGANGLVGSRVCHQLNAGKHEVMGVGRGARRVGGAFSYREVDLTRERDVEAALTEWKPEVIVHAASMTEVDACERDPEAAFAANVLATANVARSARSLGAHLVHVSTDYVFDGAAGPYGEEDVPNPRGVYSTTKHIAEQTVHTLASSWAVARTAVVYGWPPANRANFGAWLVGALRAGQEVRLFEDQFVSPSYADSVAAMLVELGERKLSGIWNTAGAEVVNRVQFAQALCEVFGFSKRLLIPVKMADANLPSPRPARTGLRPDKAVAELKAKPLPLLDALQHFYQDFRQG